ncbi:ribose transport system permease protein RbsC [Clostridium acetireducens DSM 10703]|jgi:ribose transport system permease protein|uniref:Ribose transport system permease protein RbsC n=1 Tax=Clostridium acetireducens DSM 10703 TaxID=1121290 RepID=A0A1E8EW67_9CLOT|nr:ribose ABC transporter permease [Clostridium acetireducens]OFI01505.1 ribose transport system permease protein RbsC [Clostridium acetireducens DSM 10703]
MEKDIKSLLLKYKTFIGLIVLCIVISIITPKFLTITNIINVLTQVSVNAIIAVGMCFVILTGGIDLSVGSTLAVSGAIAASMVYKGANVFTAMVVALIIGALIGLFNGIIISKGRIQAFIVTLASMTIFRGVTYVYTEGTPISGLSESFMIIGNDKILGIPLPVIIMFLVLFIAWYLLSQTRYGRYVYALGGNEDSSRLSGINTDKIKTLVYVICGATAALSGIIVTSRIGSASPNAGVGFELDAIAAVVLGGTSLAGGEGSVIGTILGAMIIGVLNNGLNIMNVSPFYQSIVKGFVILLAVMLDKKNK